MIVELTVNGEHYRLELPPERRLSSVIRDDIGLTATKLGCGEGACGACAVLMDGVAINSCLVLAGAAHGHSIVTAEGIGADGTTALQQAFLDEDALQCGFCTPGQVISATSLLAINPHPTPHEILVGMSGNICRCGAYSNIARAVAVAAGEPS
jgi:aerobic-type carbon monoxide dehydrogenase small subunit (CoxS/CutS family)